MRKVILFIAMVMVVFSCKEGSIKGYLTGNYSDNSSGNSFENSEFHKVDKIVEPERNILPKNIILLIGDGMGLTQLYSGMTANKGNLYIENFENIGLVKTYSKSNYITDSGAAGTAIACGEKTFNHAIGMGMQKDTLKSILEYAEENGLATGLVAASGITHATPASFIAHVDERGKYQEIASHFLNTDIDVVIGGGREDFQKRDDKRDLVEELKARNYKYETTLDGVKNFQEGKLLALLSDDHIAPYSERGDYLPVSALKAAEILDKSSDKGFFLMVEASQIDWAGHDTNTQYMVEEMLDFDRTIGEILKFAAKDKETLVIVAADHETGGAVIVDGDLEKGEVTMRFASTSHSAVMVPLFAFGPGSDKFRGIYENTAIFDKMMDAFGFVKE